MPKRFWSQENVDRIHRTIRKLVVTVGRINKVGLVWDNDNDKLE